MSCLAIMCVWMFHCVLVEDGRRNLKVPNVALLGSSAFRFGLGFVKDDVEQGCTARL